ncbi:MAG: ATP-binding protein, partial [Flavobacteriaceae bacterium]
ASDMLDVPICLISLVDKDRQWFKSKVGLDADQTPRNISFCQYTIMGSSIMEIENAAKDSRFKDSPLVKGAPNIVFYAGFPLIDDDGHAIGTLCVIDNKPKKLNEQQRGILTTLSSTIMSIIKLRRQKQEAERLARVRDEFLSNMSHEIRTPLNAIIGFNDLLFKTKLDEEQQEYLGIVYKASQNLKLLINDVLDVSKLESGKIQLETRPTCLVEVTDHILKLQSNSAITKGIQLSKHIDSNIPTYVNADSTRLTQILINLTNNAVKFTDYGTVHLDIEVLKRTETHVLMQFSVRDTGVGIDQENLKKIFERFTQAEKCTTRIYGGSGLGLNIVKMLVDLHGGDIEVESEPGKGSTFRVKIEYEITPVECPDTQAELKLNENLPNIEGTRVLLVEDNQHNQLLAMKYLDKAKVITELAGDGRIALEKLKKSTCDVVVMDLQMPNMDGYECTQYIREKLGSQIPIIGCSAHSLADERKRCLEMGMNDYITKPYAQHELVRVIHKHIHAISDTDSIPVEMGELTVRKENEIFSPKDDDFKKLFLTMQEEEGEEFVGEIKSIYRETIPDHLMELSRMVRECDLTGLGQKAHFFKGSFGALGFHGGKQLCIDIETSVKEANAPKAISHAADLIHYLEDIFDATSQNSGSFS